MFSVLHSLYFLPVLRLRMSHQHGSKNSKTSLYPFIHRSVCVVDLWAFSCLCFVWGGPTLFEFENSSSAMSKLKHRQQRVTPLMSCPLGAESGDHCGGGHCGCSIPRPRDVEQGQSAGSPGLWTGGPLLCRLRWQRGAAQRQPPPNEVDNIPFNIWQSLKGLCRAMLATYRPSFDVALANHSAPQNDALFRIKVNVSFSWVFCNMCLGACCSPHPVWSASDYKMTTLPP